jgi:hypothetical protein
MVDRKVVPFDEFYYQLKLTHVFQKHPVYVIWYIIWLSTPSTPLKYFLALSLPLHAHSIPRYIISIMLSIILILLKSPPHFLPPVPQTVGLSFNV